MRIIKKGKHIVLVHNTEENTIELVEISTKQVWDIFTIAEEEDAKEVYRYAEKHYTDGI